MTPLRNLMVVTAVVLTAPVLAAPAAGAASAPGSACTPGAPSAVNQYCEDIPSATGGHQVGANTPALAQSLPPATVSRIVHANAAATPGQAKLARTLLGLPAPRAAPAAAALPMHALTPTSPGGLSDWWGLAVALGLIAVGFGSIAVRNRRHGRSTPPAADLQDGD